MATATTRNPLAAHARAPNAPQRLASLLAQISDLAVISEIVDDFVNEAGAADDDLRRAFADGDTKAACRIAHTLASTAKMVGATELSALSREIERLADACDMAGALVRMRGLGAAVQEALRAVTAERDALVANGGGPA